MSRSQSVPQIYDSGARGGRGARAIYAYFYDPNTGADEVCVFCTELLAESFVDETHFFR